MVYTSTKETGAKSVQKRIRPGAKALIVHKGKILVLTEKTSRGEIISDFPGGGLEYGETVVEALVREVKEETGLVVEPVKPVGAWSFLLEHWGAHIVCIGYQCKVQEPFTIDFTKNPADEDIFEAKWYTKEEMLAGDILQVPEMLHAVALVEI